MLLTKLIGCVASVLVEFCAFSLFERAEEGGRREERKEMLSGKPREFEKRPIDI